MSWKKIEYDRKKQEKRKKINKPRKPRKVQTDNFEDQDLILWED